MNEYQIERAEKAKTFQKQIKAIALALNRVVTDAVYVAPDEKHIDGAERVGTISLGNGRAIHFSKVWNKNRVEVSGVFPRNAKGEGFHPQSYDKSPYTSISISLERAPEAVAKDIARRFIPDYKGEYARQLERSKNSDKYANDTRETICLAAEAAGVTVPDNHYRQNALSIPWGEVEASGTELTLKLRSLNREQALEVLELVANFIKRD